MQRSFSLKLILISYFVFLFLSSCSLSQSYITSATPTIMATKTPSPTITSTPANTPSITPSTITVQTRESIADGMVQVYVPAGEFRMGSKIGSENGREDENPLHTIFLDTYWIDQTEVTNGMFQAFIDDTGYKTDAEKRNYSWIFNKKTDMGWEIIDGADWKHPIGPESSLEGLAAHPVVQISWNDAAAYCKWAGRELPTEAQWEKAARGPDERIYPWGNEFDCNNGNFNYYDEPLVDFSVVKGGPECDKYDTTAPVGSFPEGASPYGAFDMAGNVEEWVADWYDKNFYVISSASDVNPENTVGSENKVLRGRSWYFNEYYVRSAIRDYYPPNNSYQFIGFRCASSDHSAP